VFSLLNLPVLRYGTKELHFCSFRREGYVKQSSVRVCLEPSPLQYSVIAQDTAAVCQLKFTFNKKMRRPTYRKKKPKILNDPEKMFQR